MTSVEKRRSGRKSGSHRKHSDGGYSDTSSGGSFLDENDREVSSLTDRAFRSLCIGDEAVYNDSDLNLSSPCTQRDRQLAFSHRGQDREDREREELKRTAHENFSLRVQQYGQDWIHGGMYGAEIHREPQWEVYGDRAHGRVSATFQHSYVETTQQANTLREEQLSFFSNGATELSSEQRRSRSRVSSLIRAFNSEGQRDGPVVDERLKEWNDETTWDKSALMSIQRELSEFSTSYQQNFNSGHFPSAGQFSSQDANFYSSEVAAMAHMSHNSAPSIMKSSHSKHTMSAQVNCNSNFFIHSELSPFRVWRNYNRFPFQHGEVSGFMHCSEYKTPMYKELSLEDQQRGPYRGNRHLRNNLAPAVPPAHARSTSTSKMLQKASSVEKRCESELAGHYPHRKRAQSLGPNRLPSQRPSTASPTIEMSRRVRDTISSVKALQQKIKMMTEQNITTGVIPSQQQGLYSNQSLISNTSTTPFNISQLLTPFVPAHQEADFQQYAVSPQPVEHPPVRAESRGATPDVRMSSYKSRATSLLFNLKDNRKRVKSTYSPTKFKGMENAENLSNQEPRETVIDMPDFPDPYNQLEESSRANAGVYQYHSPGMPLNSQPASVHTGQYPEYAISDHQPAQMQGQMVHHTGFTGFIPENYPSNQVANGQNLYEDFASFAPYKQDMMDNVGTLEGNVYTLNPSYPRTPKLTADNNKSREYLISKANTEQAFNETVGRVFTKVERYEQLQDNKYDYNNAPSQDWWRQTNSQDTQKPSVKAAASPWKQEMRQENLPTKDHELCPPQKNSDKNEIKGNYVAENYHKYTDQEYRNQHAFYSAKDQPAAKKETSPRKQYIIPKIQEMQSSLQPVEAKTEFEQNLLSDPDNISAPIIQMKDRQLVEVKAEQVMPEPIKAQHTPAELAEAQKWAQVEQSKAEQERLILARQTVSEKVTTEEAKSELTKQERLKQPRTKQPEKAREEQTEADTTRVQKETDKPRNITEDIREELGKQVKAEQAETERLKQEHIKTELPNTEQAQMRQAKTEQVSGKRISAEQVEEEQVKAGEAEKEAEQIRTEKVNVEQTAAECRDTEATKTEQMKETKAEQVKTKEVEVEKVKSDHIKVMDNRQAKDEKNEMSKIIAKGTRAQTITVMDEKLEERKAAQATLEQRKTDKMLERSAKLTAKLTSTQPVKSEPDKVEQVKTELAKAKAELAKIKEKMRGDQKEKVRNKTKVDDIAKSNKNEDYRKQDQGAQIQQRDTLYKNDKGAEDYDQLRQKYGFTNAVSTNKTKESAAENGSSTDDSETQNTSLNKVETVNKDTSNDSSTTKLTVANMENKEVPHSYSEGTETLYVYSESSKEFKLSSADYCLTNADKTTIGDNATKIVNNDSAEKHDSLRETDGSQQKDSDLAKVLPVERKSKSTEPNLNLGKDLHFTPPKALSQKERAQTKQDILTSKIKAHAEKEISAIKEKGFAKRDGIISKGSMKQLPGNQTVIARQKPQSQEVYKKSENVLSSNTTPKHKMEFSGAQNNQVKHVSPPSLAMTKPAAAATLLAPQNPLKTNSKEPKQAETKSPVQNQERENPSGLSVQNNEQSPIIDKGKEQENCGEISGKHKENLKDSIDKKKVDLAEVKGVKAASCKPVMTEKAENKEAAHEDTEPSISLVLGQKEVPVADNSLQIMGIMVTVRERKPSMSSAQENNSIHEEKKEHGNSEPNKCHPNSDFVLREAKTTQKDIKSKDMQKMVDQAKDKIKSPENVQKNKSTSETRKTNVPENVTQNTSSINAKPQRETELLVEKDVSFSVTVPAKNIAETKFLVCEQNTTSRKTKDLADESDKESSTKREQTGDNNLPPKHNEAQTGETVGSVHIDSIAIRVLPTAMERGNMKMEGKHPITTIPSDVVPANDHKHQHTAPSSQEGKVNNDDLMPASSEKKMNDSVEDKLGVQHILSSVRKLSESLKNSNHENRVNSTSENIPGEQPLQGDYFQVQGATETSNKQHNNSTIVVDASKDRGLPENKTDVSNESHKERKNEAFVFSVDQGKRKIEESGSKSTQEENMKRKHWEEKEKLASKHTDGSTERCNNEKMAANETNHIRKHHTENHPKSSERQSSRNSKREHTLKEKPEVKPKPKERVSTIPEISALADYARLKVIVSDDKEADTVKELPPNKKEGFFPLIQSRHSRRPVFTADPQDLSVKEKGLPNKTEMNAKVNKELKAPVFPITEKEHQKTGLFKLGDKKRQEKISQDNEVNHGALDNVKTNCNHKERKNLSTVQTGQTAVGDTHSQVDKGICQPNNNPPTTTSSVANMPRNTSEKQNRNSVPQSTVGQIHQRKGSVTLPRKDERVEKQQDKDTGAKTEEGRTDKIKTEGTSTQQEDTKAKQQVGIKTMNREVSKSEEEKREEAMKIKHMIEESRASLAEEERRASQREEERRTREREAVAAKIKERREKQREAEIRAEEERRVKQTEEEMKTKQREEEVRINEIREDRRKKAEENSQTKLRKEEQQSRAVQEERQRKAAQEDQQTKEEQKKRLTQEEQHRRVEQEEKKTRAVEEEQKRSAALEEQKRRAAEEKQRRAAEEQQRRAAEEKQRRAAEEEQQRRAEEEKQRRAAEEEQQRRAAEEKQRRAAEEEQQRRAAEEKQRRAAEEEQQRRAEEEKQRRAAEEKQRRAAEEEQQRRAAEEKQRRAAQEEQQRRAAEEKQSRAAEEKQQRAAEEEQQKKAAEEEQQRRAAEEKQRRAAEEEQQRRAAEEKQMRAEEEKQRRAAQEEQQQRRAEEEKQRRAAQEEQHSRAAEELQRRAAAEEQHMRAAEEKQRRAVQEEQQRRAAAEEQHMRAAEEEQQRRAAQEKQHRRAAEEQQRRLVQEQKQIRSTQKEQQRRPTEEQQRTQEEKQTKHIEEKIFSDDEEEKKRKQREEEKASHNLEEERIRHDGTKAEQLYIGQGRERYCSPEKARHLEENEAALNEKKKTQEQTLAQRQDDIQAKKKKEELAVHNEQVKVAQTEKQRSAAHMDTLQYYAITSTESERKPRERQMCSPLTSQQRNNPSGLDSTEESASHSRPYRPHTPASPAPSLTRSNTSSPALGTKPLMFRVKDNTTRGSSFIKSVIPRFHKNFGEDFRVGSPMDRRSDRGEDEQEIMRCNAGTPVYHDTGLNQFGSINEYSCSSSSQDYIVPIPHHRPYSRRSIAMDEEDARSVVSNMSEGVESFATSVADLADVRGLCDYDRPESACSFSSDVSRSLGKPPAVPPKSEKALRRAKRLTTRRIKKELSKAAADGSVEAGKEVSSIPSSSSTEVRSTNRHAVASPHFSSPVTLAHAPALGSLLPSSQTEHSSPHHSFRASPHATGPISIPVASPHATAPISLPSVSPHATGPASELAPPKAVAHVSSSPTLHHANHPAPVTQYQVESSYPQSYPLTQRKVLQDPGSGQYFVVDLPIQVKTKTFFDPETGKYVQLNVRESGQSISQQPRHQHPQLQSKMQIKPQQQPLSQTGPAEKPYVLYQGYQDYPKSYQSAPINNVHPHRSSDPVTLCQQDQRPVGESHIYGYPAPETEQNSGGHRYSPEKTPYMDTVKDMDKKYNRVYSTYGSQESFPESDTNSQLAGSSVCENDTSAHSRYQPRDIITMSELEDFMEVSDW